MLSDEEKKAMKLLNDMIKHKPDTIRLEWRKGIYALQLVLNLIEKQSKEIEELKEESKEYQIGFAQGCYEKDLDWEDKIKAKIEEEDEFFFKTKDVRHANRYKAYKELLEKEE